MKFTRLQKLLAVLFILSVFPAFHLIQRFIVPTVHDWWNADTIAALSAAYSEKEAGHQHASKREWDSAIASYPRAIELLPASLAKEGNSVMSNLADYY